MFRILYAPEVVAHISAIQKGHHSLIRRAIKKELSLEPDRETRNRKPLLRPIDLGAGWELRLGPDNRYRVFYNVNRKENEVHILAIGVKIRNVLSIGKKEWKL